MKRLLIVSYEMGTDNHHGQAADPLPGDIEALTAIGQQLADYVASLDRDLGTANDWLLSRADAVVIGHHRFERAIKLGLEQDAINLLVDMGEITGLVLSVQDFRERARTTFGPQSRLAALIDRPVALLPPALTGGPSPPVFPLLQSVSFAPPPVPEKPKPLKWWQRGPLAPDPAVTENTDLQRAWRAARNEITAQQSERHYYIDSLMEWVGNTLTGGATDGGLMADYQDPRYIAVLAEQDHQKSLISATQPLRQLAAEYARFAALLDDQKIDVFAAALPALFPVVDTPDIKSLRQLFLKDYGAESFAEIALTSVTHRDDKLRLFKAALAVESELRFTGAKSPNDILNRIRTETEAETEPLPHVALTLARRKLALNEKPERKNDQLPTLSELFIRAVNHLESVLLSGRRNGARPMPRP